MTTQPLPVVACRVNDGNGERIVIALATVSDAQVVGLSARQVVGQLLEPSATEVIEPTKFARNPAFFDFMHDVIRRHGPKLPALQAAARAQREGHVFIIDGRTPTPEGRVPPEDIIGGFQVREGIVEEATYSANPNYRLLSELGFTQLDSALLEHLQNESRQPPVEAPGVSSIIARKPWYKLW